MSLLPFRPFAAVSDRFYAPQPLDRDSVSLTGSEAHHLARVLRNKPGDRVVLFDGAGTEASAEVASVGKNHAVLRVLDTRVVPLSQDAPLIVATAVPKGDRFRWLVEKATELGVRRLVPLETERSVVVPRDGKLQKMRNTVIAACKQCERSRLMQIDEPVSWTEFVRREFRGSRAVVAHHSGGAVNTTVPQGENGPAVVCIGPEGDFTDDEIGTAVAAGASVVHLGPRVLRTETAAVALASYFLLVSTSVGDSQPVEESHGRSG